MNTQQRGQKQSTNDNTNIRASNDSPHVAIGKTSATMSRPCTPTKQHVTIMDWDDTLCPTSHIFKRKFGALDHQTISQQLHLFAHDVYHLLLLCIQLNGVGNVYIVTNGGQHWVQQSLLQLIRQYPRRNVRTDLETERENHAQPETDYLMAILNLLQSERNVNGIRVISAKHYYATAFHRYRHMHAPHAESIARDNDNYHNKYGNSKQNNSMQWKLFTFRSILDGYYYRKSDAHIPSALHLLCVGDSTDEYIASTKSKQCIQQTYANQLQNKQILCHRIKLKSVPTISDLRQQINFLRALLLLWNSNKQTPNIDCTAPEIDIDFERERKNLLHFAQTRQQKADMTNESMKRRNKFCRQNRKQL